MKHRGSSAACIAHLIERAARCEGKTGEGKVSTEAIASILGPPGEPIFSETGVGGVGTRISAISLQSDLHLLKTPDMFFRVEFPTPVRAYMRVTRRTRAAVENSFTAVQHLTKALFLSKPVEPLLSMEAIEAYRTSEAHEKIKHGTRGIKAQVAVKTYKVMG